MQVSIASLFGVQAPATATVEVADKNPAVPAAAYRSVNPHYFFAPSLLKKLMLFLITKPTRISLFLTGDTGTGKTSLVEQIAARLNIPVFSIACSGKLRLSHFVGSYTLKNGSTVWNDGPLTLAMRFGGVFMPNEATRLDQSEQMALADVLDSGVIIIPDSGEIVVAAPGFRVIATGNSVGHGDESGAYSGEKVSSAAFLDRFQKLRVDYMSEDDEAALLGSIAPELGGDTITKMVDFATRIRGAFVGRGGDMRTIISTRTLAAWALEAVRYQKFNIADQPLQEALHDTILNGATAADASAMLEIWDNWI